MSHLSQSLDRTSQPKILNLGKPSTRPCTSHLTAPLISPHLHGSAPAPPTTGNPLTHSQHTAHECVASLPLALTSRLTRINDNDAITINDYLFHTFCRHKSFCILSLPKANVIIDLDPYIYI